jgi:hypothetical protein
MTRFLRRRSNLRSAGVNRALSATLLFAILVCGVGAASDAAPLDAIPAKSNGLHGPQPFATILCKFADVSAEPDPIAYFERLLGSAYPGLDHYWREVSYGAINLDGSAVMGWYSLPHPQSVYQNGAPNLPVPTMESPVDLQRLAGDCVSAAGEAVEWSRYVGINLIFNIDLDRPRGGEVCLPQDGTSRCYRTTWLWPGWYHNQSIWAHEMGHTFGLQHSSVGNGNGYGNMWDVMSVDGPCRTEPPYGRIGQHPIAYQKDILGWIPAERIFVAGPDSQATITLEQTAAPAGNDYLLAQIPIRELARPETGQSEWESGRVGADRRYYTVEARRRTGYDASLPGDAVIIHEVDLDGDPQVRPVSTGLGGNVFLGATTGSAARWLPGQIFRDAQNGIAVSIDRATSTGFVVTIYTGPLAATRLSSESEETTAEDIVGTLPAARRSNGQTKPITLTAKSGAYAIWTETQTEAGDGFMSAGSRRADIVFSHHPAGGDWGPVVRVNDNGRDSRSNPALAVDRQGNAYAAWVDYRDGDAAIYAATRPVGGEWGENARVSSGAANGYTGLTIIVDWEDDVHVLWEGLDRCSGDEAILGGRE